MGQDIWKTLLSDENKHIQMQTITLLRNIACKHAHLLLDSSMEEIGYSLPCKEIVIEKLSFKDDEMTRQCLFLICNICADRSRTAFAIEKEILSAIQLALVSNLIF